VCQLNIENFRTVSIQSITFGYHNRNKNYRKAVFTFVNRRLKFLDKLVGSIWKVQWLLLSFNMRRTMFIEFTSNHACRLKYSAYYLWMQPSKQHFDVMDRLIIPRYTQICYWNCKIYWRHNTHTQVNTQGR